MPRVWPLQIATARRLRKAIRACRASALTSIQWLISALVIALAIIFTGVASHSACGATLGAPTGTVSSKSPATPRATPQQVQPQAQSVDDEGSANGRPASAADTTGLDLGGLPEVDIAPSQEGYELPIQLLLLLTVLTLAPAIIILMTSFTRLVVVFSILRTALGLRRSPPRQVVIGLSLFLSLFIMQPVLETVHQEALRPYMNGEITQQTAYDRASAPMKRFMLEQTREKDLMLFMDMGDIESFESARAAPLHVVVPAFVISELRIAFQIGFMIFLPFLIVDLVVASVLMSMGMMMLPPVMISLPIKLLLFVLSDGWYLIVESLVQGYM